MEMDPLTKNHQIPLFSPSFPLFNFDLLKQQNFELYVPDLVPLDRISEKIRIRMQQEINLNGDFELFEKKEKKKVKSSQNLKYSAKIAKKAKQGNLAAVSSESESDVASLKLKRTGKKLFKTALSKHHLGQNSSPNKRARDPFRSEDTKITTFPSLASILGGDGESSCDENEVPFRGFKINRVKPEREEKTESIFQSELFEKKNSRIDFFLEENTAFEKTIEPFSCDASLFSQLFSETKHLQNKRGCNKKVKENPRLIDGNFHSYKMFNNIAGNKKMGSFDLAMEKEAVASSFSVPLEIQLEENVALGLNSNVVVTK